MRLLKLKLTRKRVGERYEVWALIHGTNDELLLAHAEDAGAEMPIKLVAAERGYWLRLGKTPCAHFQCALWASVEEMRGEQEPCLN